MKENNKLISVISNSETCAVERVLECLSAQGLEFDGVIASKTFDDKIVINISLQLDDSKVEKVLNRLEKLVSVYGAVELNAENSLIQQLALIKFDAKKISDKLLNNIVNNSNISIILPLGAENNKNYISNISNFGKNYDSLVVKVAESGDFIDGFINDHKDAIVEVVRTSDLAIAIK